VGVTANGSKDVSSISKTKTSGTPFMMSTALNIRGGGFMSYMMGFGKQSAADLYRQTLEEQVLLLDRQLRQARDEMGILRKQFTTRSAKPAPKISSQERTLLKQQLASLTSQVKQLERMKLELEDMLERESIKVQELTTKLAEQEQLTQALQEKYIKQLQTLQEQLELKAQKQLQQLQEIMEQRIQQATEVAHQAAMAQIGEKVAEATETLRLEKDQELEWERKRSVEAVEKEKVKMRKLVRALANREKKLFAKKTSAQESSSSSGSYKASTSYRAPTTKTAPTSRGPFK
jgi:chromosome segregation ATPase